MESATDSRLAGAVHPHARGTAAQARTLGYSDEDLAAVPDGAKLGLGCGNRVALASLKPGHTVLELGTGAGEGQREPPLFPIR